jgi:hypothetical protein
VHAQFGAGFRFIRTPFQNVKPLGRRAAALPSQRRNLPQPGSASRSLLILRGRDRPRRSLAGLGADRHAAVA